MRLATDPQWKCSHCGKNCQIHPWCPCVDSDPIETKQALSSAQSEITELNKAREEERVRWGEKLTGAYKRESALGQEIVELKRQIEAEVKEKFEIDGENQRLTIANSRLQREVDLRKRQMDRQPFCPDHRDKVHGLSCRQCEIERLNGLLEEIEKVTQEGISGLTIHDIRDASRRIAAIAARRKE